MAICGLVVILSREIHLVQDSGCKMEVLSSEWTDFCETILQVPGKRKLIIDCDAGTDDAEAILMCLNCPNVEVVGITCVNGNIGRDQVVLNVRRVLSVCGRTDIPVFAGAVAPLVQPIYDANFFHGPDGLGGVDRDGEPSEENYPPVQNENAVSALIRLCRDGVISASQETLTHQIQLAQLAISLEKELLDLAGKGNFEGARKIELDVKNTKARFMSVRRAVDTIGNNDTLL
eukprot:gene10340-2476_t